MVNISTSHGVTGLKYEGQARYTRQIETVHVKPDSVSDCHILKFQNICLESVQR